MEVPVGWEGESCLFLCFLRVDSVPLISERLGEPGRLRALAEDDNPFLVRSVCLLARPDGVFVPFEDAPDWDDEGFVLTFSLSDAVFFSSSFLTSSALRRSVSESSSSLCIDH